MDIPIYCLAFDKSDRKKRMTERFTGLDLIQNVTFQEPIQIDSPLIDFYLRNRGEKHDLGGRRAASGIIACMSSLRSFISSGKPYGIFCEDDVHIRKTFKDDIPKIISKIETFEKKPSIVLLGYLAMTDPRLLDDYPLYQKEPPSIIDNIFYLLSYPDDIWGCQMILFSRENAMDLVEKFDRPFHLSCPNSSFTGDWTLTKVNPRLLVYPMLAVEEGQVNNNHLGQFYFHQNCHRFNYDPRLYL